ncbi:Succinylornithine transaminase [hydrothermal vent metagenome]|uniref:Succinylornithine transaminase n=1 Tax=hydrothermal vent metagenome TaxID=652676 RepID=A0A3B1DIU1_9ZZZZ
MNKTIGQKFREDERVIKAKQLIQEALVEHQESLTLIQPAVVELKVSYEDMLNELGELRGRALYYPYLSSGIGNGALVELADGSVKYDFISGIGVHYMGHSHPQMVRAGVNAALEDTVMQGHLQQGEKTIELMEHLVTMACTKGGNLKHCFLTSSGAMANENAFKIIFQNKEPAKRLLAFEGCFTGRSLATVQMTYNQGTKQGLPKVLDVDYIPFFDANDPKESTQKSVDQLRKLLKEHPREYAVMCFELIQGEGGYYPGSRDFFMALMDILKEQNIAIMVDEIQTFGRTEELFAFQYFGLDNYVDVVTIGKMSQVCATLFTPQYNPKSGLLSQTFTASSSAIHAACTILDEVENNGYLGKDGKVMRYGEYFRSCLKKLSEKYPNKIKGPFGLGAMVGFTVFDGSVEKTKGFLTALYEAGVIGFMAGKEPARVRFLMPIGAVTEKDIESVCELIEKVLTI